MGEQIQRAVLLSHLASYYKHDSPKPAEKMEMMIAVFIVTFVGFGSGWYIADRCQSRARNVCFFREEEPKLQMRRDTTSISSAT